MTDQEHIDTSTEAVENADTAAFERWMARRPVPESLRPFFRTLIVKCDALAEQVRALTERAKSAEADWQAAEAENATLRAEVSRLADLTAKAGNACLHAGVLTPDALAVEVMALRAKLADVQAKLEANDEAEAATVDTAVRAAKAETWREAAKDAQHAGGVLHGRCTPEGCALLRFGDHCEAQARAAEDQMIARLGEWRTRILAALSTATPPDLSALVEQWLVEQELIDPTGPHTQKPGHGNCCTCQRCGFAHDECRCEVNERTASWLQLRAALAAHAQQDTKA